MRVAYATAARFDLIEIGEWIARENPLRAASFVNELEDACESLAFMPRAFPVLLRRRGRQIRRKPFESYLIFYFVARDRVEIMRVLHGARDYEKLLIPE